MDKPNLHLVDKDGNHDSLKYSHESGNVYGYVRKGKGNHRLLIELSKSLGSRNLGLLVQLLEQRHEAWGTKWYGYINHTPALNKINKGKKDGDAGFQKSILEDLNLKDKETFGRLFDKVGNRFTSSSKWHNEKHRFGGTSAEGDYGYLCYHNRTDHEIVFIRNDPFCNKWMNDIRCTAGLPFVHDHALSLEK